MGDPDIHPIAHLQRDGPARRIAAERRGRGPSGDIVRFVDPAVDVSNLERRIARTRSVRVVVDDDDDERWGRVRSAWQTR